VPGPIETADENYDVTILTERRRPLDGNFIARRLACSEVIMCAAPEYLDIHGRPEHPRELANHEAIVPSFMRELGFQTRSATEGDRETFKIERPHAGLSTVQTDTLDAAALAGMGITGLPTRKHVPARTRAFVDFLVETFGGEVRDPWLSAAGCETQTSRPRARRRSRAVSAA